MVRYFILHTLLLISTFGAGQPNPHWYVINQPYLKLLIDETGWFRLEERELRKFHFPILEDSLAYLQLFKHGQEVPIRLASTSPHLALEFFAEKNDALLEQSLYLPNTSPLHPALSLYSDTTAYYLTYGPTLGKRVVSYACNTLSRGLGQRYYWRQEKKQWTDEYTAGTIYPLGATYQNGVILTDYEEGEGYCSQMITAENPLKIALPLHHRVDSIPYIDVVIRLVGRKAGAHQVTLSSEKTLQKSILQNYSVQDLEWRLKATGDSIVVHVQVQGAISLVNVQWRYAQNETQLVTDAVHKLYLKSDEVLQLAPDSLLCIYNLKTHELIKSSEMCQIKGPLELWKTRTVKRVQAAKLMYFKDVLQENTDYLLVSHASIMTNYTLDSQHPLRRYSDYRASSAGGDYRVAVMDIEEVYDQFNFGIRSPQALRNLINTYAEKQLKYVFLVGRSKDPQSARFSKNGWKDDLLPNAGWPGSDIALTMRSFDEPQPQVAIGRLFVSRLEEVAAYFTKVQHFEAHSPSTSWRKNILHLSGGYSDAERSVFASYIDSFAAQLKQSESQFQIKSYYKEHNERQQKIDLSDDINQGAGLVTLFGHSSLTETDLDFGWVTDTANNYRNWSKYPAFWLNGCASGNMYFRNKTLSTDWVNAVDKGAVLFVAHSHHGAVPGLKRYTDALYHTIADTNYVNAAFGEIMRVAAGKYLAAYPGLTDVITVQQMNLQGDPAIKIFPARKADFYIDSLSVAITRSNQEVYLTFEIGNFGFPWKGEIEVALELYDQNISIFQTLERIAYKGKYKQVIRLPLPFSGFLDLTELVLHINIDPNSLLGEEDRTNNQYATQILPLKLQHEKMLSAYIKPNPVFDQAVLCLNTPFFMQEFLVTLTFYTTVGDKLLEFDRVVSSSYQEMEIPIRQFPRGVYFYTVQQTNSQEGTAPYQARGKLVVLP